MTQPESSGSDPEGQAASISRFLINGHVVVVAHEPASGLRVTCPNLPDVNVTAEGLSEALYRAEDANDAAMARQVAFGA